MKKIKTTCFINFYKKELINLQKLDPVERYFDFLPRIGESVSLFPDGITSFVEDIEYNFDGSISLIFKGINNISDYNYTKEMISLHKSNKNTDFTL